jgi:PAS domain S-box-containing protein
MSDHCLDNAEAPAAGDGLLHASSDHVSAAMARRAEEVLDAIGDGLITLDRDYRVVTANRAALRVDGRPKEYILGRTHWELWPASVGTEVDAAYRRAMEQRIPAELTISYTYDGREVWAEIRAWPITGGIAVLHRDITGRKRDEQRLRESEARFRSLAEHAPDAIYMVDPVSRRIEYLSPAFERIWGEPRESVQGNLARWVELLHPEDRPRVLGTIPALCKDGEPVDTEYRILRGSDGELRHIRDTAVPICDAKGRVLRVVGIAHDATARKQAEAHRELLIREMNHRVKNTLATVQSIAAQTLRTGCEPATRKVFEERLIALARAHDLLTRGNWEGARLREVAETALGPHMAGGRIALSGPDARLTPKAALAIGMALHELATNAGKYGALSTEAGRVTLDWRLAEDGLRLCWRETGGPPVRPPARRGFGTRLMERGLPHELHGGIRLDFAPEGLCCEIEAPPAALASEGLYASA